MPIHKMRHLDEAKFSAALALLPKTITHYPTAIEIDAYYLIVLKNGHYLLVAKERHPLFSILHFTYEVVILEDQHFKLIDPKTSLYGIAKEQKSRGSLDMMNHEQHQLNKAGLAAEKNVVFVGEKPFIFMKYIDEGISLRNAIKNSKPGDILQCIINAMNNALLLREKGVINLDIQMSNILFPSGTIIDLEYSASKDEKASSKFLLPPLPGKISLTDLYEDLSLNKKLLLLKKNSVGRIEVAPLAVDNQFSSVINSVIDELETISFPDKEKIFIQLANIANNLRCLKCQMTGNDYNLENAILDLTEIIGLIKKTAIPEEKQSQKEVTEDDEMASNHPKSALVKLSFIKEQTVKLKPATSVVTSDYCPL